MAGRQDKTYVWESLNGELLRSDLRKITFLCSDIYKPSDLSNVKSAEELLALIFCQEKNTVDGLAILAELLECANLRRLLNKIGISDQHHPKRISKYRRSLFKIAGNLVAQNVSDLKCFLHLQEVGESSQFLGSEVENCTDAYDLFNLIERVTNEPKDVLELLRKYADSSKKKKLAKEIKACKDELKVLCSGNSGSVLGAQKTLTSSAQVFTTPQSDMDNSFDDGHIEKVSYVVNQPQSAFYSGSGDHCVEENAQVFTTPQSDMDNYFDDGYIEKESNVVNQPQSAFYSGSGDHCVEEKEEEEVGHEMGIHDKKNTEDFQNTRSMDETVTQQGALASPLAQKLGDESEETDFTLMLPEVPGSASTSTASDFHPFHQFKDFDEFDRYVGINDEKKIGEGGFGSVFDGKVKFNEIDVVVKNQHNTGELSVKQYKMEKESAWIKHPFVVPVLAVYEDKEHARSKLVYPKMARDLETVLDKKELSGELTFSIRIRIAFQLAEAVYHLHCKSEYKKAVLHRDLKTSNILIDKYYNIRVGDLGFCKLLANAKSSATVTQTVKHDYSDPDILGSKKYKPAHDLYSVGLVMLRLYTGREMEAIREVLKHPAKQIEANFYKLASEVWSNAGKSTHRHFVRLAISLVSHDLKKRKLDEVCSGLKELYLKSRGEDSASFFDDQGYNDRCVACLMYPRMKISLCWDERCYFYCKQCLAKKDLNPVFCPNHGSRDAEPIGNRHHYLFVIGGKDEAGCNYHRDATRFKNIMTDPRIGGIRESNVTFLTWETEEQNLTSSLVQKKLTQVIKKMNELDCNKRKRLIFFYSGHASKNLLLLKDILPPNKLRDIMSNTKNADVVLFMDCCRALQPELQFKITKTKTSCRIIAASDFEKKAIGAGCGDYNSQFTNHLIRCLTPQEGDGLGYIGWNQLCIKLMTAGIRPAPACSGEVACAELPLVYSFGHMPDHLVYLEVPAGEEEEKTVMHEVYLREDKAQSIQNVDKFINEVLESYKHDYGEYSCSERYIVKGNLDMDQVKELWKLHGAPRVVVDRRYTQTTG